MLGKLTLSILLIFTSWTAGEETTLLCKDEDTARYDIQDAVRRKIMTFIEVETGKQTICDYKVSFLSSARSKFLDKENEAKADVVSKMENGFSQESYHVGAFWRSIGEETGVSSGTLDILNAETEEKIGSFDFDFLSKTILTGRLKNRPLEIREVVRDGKRLLPLFKSSQYPAETSGHFAFFIENQWSGCLVLHERPRKKVLYSLYLNKQIQVRNHEDIITLTLLLPMFRAMGTVTSR